MTESILLMMIISFAITVGGGGYIVINRKLFRTGYMAASTLFVITAEIWIYTFVKILNIIF